VEEFCAVPPRPGEDELQSLACSAGHTACCVSPYGDFYPCVQFPLTCGNVRQRSFLDIWRNSEQWKELRSIRMKDLTGFSSVRTLRTARAVQAWLPWKAIGPSAQDCEKSFPRTGIPSVNLQSKKPSAKNLIQIRMQPAGAAVSD
jgi:hypothetical protein